MITETTVTRFVTRTEIVIPHPTLVKANEEAAGYAYQRAGNGHYVCVHGDTAHLIIEKGGLIGCSCGDWTHRCKDVEGCKHMADFLKRKNSPAAKLDKRIAFDLIAAGWRKTEHGNLYPPDRESAAAERDKDVEAAMGASWNKDNPEKQSPEVVAELDPIHQDTPLGDLGVREDTENPAPTPEPGVMSTNCQYCGKKIIRQLAADLKRALEGHEATCPKRPKEQKAVVKESSTTETRITEDKNMEETTTEPQTAVQTTEPQRGFLTAAVSLDDAITAFDLYGQAKTRLLSDSDVLYIGANGKPAHKDVKDAVPYIKKSGWRKMARFFGLSVDILGKEKIWTQDVKGEKYYIWAYQIKVSHACGAFVHAEGVCSSRDKFFTKGGKVTADETNIMLKAQTVGINRGISDLLGAGEVSAEEME
jgi:hypothetical protein